MLKIMSLWSHDLIENKKKFLSNDIIGNILRTIQLYKYWETIIIVVDCNNGINLYYSFE